MTEQKEISKLLQTFFARREVLSPDVWCEKNVRLTSRQSVHQGLYSLKRTPFFRQIYQDLVNPEIRRVALKKPVQIGATQLAGNVLFYYVCNHTLPCAIFFPNQKLGQQFAERVILPGLQNIEPLKEFLTDDQDDVKKTDWTFTSCNVKAVAGGSVAALSSNAFALAIIDEANKYVSFTKDGERIEADAIDLIEDRTVSFRETKDDKIFITSTPTISHSCLISHEVLEGSNSFWYVPCPHCGTFQTLKFKNIDFGDAKKPDGTWNLNKLAKSACYRCEHCRGKITNEDKPAMLNRGEWRAHNLDAPDDFKSYNISGLYSLSFTFGDIARMFLKAKNSRSALMNFHNSVLGEAFTPQAATVSEDTINRLIERSPNYSKGEIPAPAKALILSVDTQKTDFYFMVSAILENGASAIVDYGMCPTFEDLNDILNLQYPVKATGELIGIYGGIQDAGGTQSVAVYENYVKSGGRIIPCLGRTEGHKMFAPIRQSKVKSKGGYEVPLIFVNDKTFSDILLLDVLKVSGNETLYLPSDVCQTLKDQLTAVCIVEKKDKKGFISQEYVSKRENHLFDCLKYFYGLRYSISRELDQPEQQEDSAEQTEQVPALDYSRW